mgnify:CR=1 FL=1
MMDDADFEAGSTFVFPMDDREWSDSLFDELPEELASQYGACRVLALGENGATIAALDWLGEDVAELEDLQGVPLVETAWRSFEPDSPATLVNVTEPPPDWFTDLGAAELSGEERAALEDASWRSGGNAWLSIRQKVRLAWEWRHDREGFKRRREQARREQEQRFEAPDSYDGMREWGYLEGWRNFMDDDIVDASVAIIDRAIDDLDQLPDDAAEQDRVDVIRTLVESFNELDAKHDYFIETLERDSIALAIDHMLELADLDHLGDLDDRWREW